MKTSVGIELGGISTYSELMEYQNIGVCIWDAFKKRDEMWPSAAAQTLRAVHCSLYTGLILKNQRSTIEW